MDCCTNNDKNDHQPGVPTQGTTVGPHSERLALGGSVVAAVLSSACCWLPLLLLAFGASAAGVSAFFERWRPVFLVVAVALLGAGFYVTYFRKVQCCTAGECATAPRSRGVINQVMLWVAVVFVAGFALFPNYVGVLLDTGSADASSVVGADAIEYVFTIKGMTCEACAATLRHGLAGVDGVIDARVDYATQTATIRATGVNVVSHIIDAASHVGYTATRRDK